MHDLEQNQIPILNLEEVKRWRILTPRDRLYESGMGVLKRLEYMLQEYFESFLTLHCNLNFRKIVGKSQNNMIFFFFFQLTNNSFLLVPPAVLVIIDDQ